jgi:hypothetical protein
MFEQQRDARLPKSPRSNAMNSHRELAAWARPNVGTHFPP